MADFLPHNLTSNVSNQPFTVSASTQFSGTFAPWKAFDNAAGSGQYWLANTSTGTLQVDVGPGCYATLNSYQIRVNTIPEPNRAPKDFKMQGSNDGSSWTDLDTQTNQTAWTSGQTRTFTLGSTSAAYRYFRLNISANNGDSLVQVAELFLDGTLTQQFLVSLMTANNAPSPFVASASSTFSTNSPYRAFDRSFDSLSDRWMGSGSGVDWLKIDLGTVRAIVTGYLINIRSSEPNRAPKDWTLEGSNDDSSWNTVHTVTGETGWGTTNYRTYIPTTQTTEYRYWRINITANNTDATFTQIGELMMFGTSSAIPAGGGANYYYRLIGNNSNV